MTTRASDLTPADLVARARACLTSGDEQGAIAAALVAIAEVMTAEPKRVDVEQPKCDVCEQPSDGLVNHLPPLCLRHRVEFETWVDDRRGR